MSQSTSLKLVGFSDINRYVWRVPGNIAVNITVNSIDASWESTLFVFLSWCNIVKNLCWNCRDEFKICCQNKQTNQKNPPTNPMFVVVIIAVCFLRCNRTYRHRYHYTNHGWLSRMIGSDRCCRLFTHVDDARCCLTAFLLLRNQRNKPLSRFFNFIFWSTMSWRCDKGCTQLRILPVESKILVFFPFFSKNSVLQETPLKAYESHVLPVRLLL